MWCRRLAAPCPRSPHPRRSFAGASVASAANRAHSAGPTTASGSSSSGAHHPSPQRFEKISIAVAEGDVYRPPTKEFWGAAGGSAGTGLPEIRCPCVGRRWRGRMHGPAPRHLLSVCPESVASFPDLGQDSVPPVRTPATERILRSHSARSRQSLLVASTPVQARAWLCGQVAPDGRPLFGLRATFSCVVGLPHEGHFFAEGLSARELGAWQRGAWRPHGRRRWSALVVSEGVLAQGRGRGGSLPKESA